MAMQVVEWWGYDEPPEPDVLPAEPVWRPWDPTEQPSPDADCILRWVRAAVPRVGEPVFRVGVSQCGGPGWAVAPVLV